MLERLAPEVVAGIRLLPVVHERLEMTAVVRAALAAADPRAVAVELPTALRDAALEAIDRLPRISLLVTREPGEEALVWVAAPGDPFVEAMRWARERGRAVHFIDPDLPYPEEHSDPVPDTYSILELGPERSDTPRSFVRTQCPRWSSVTRTSRGLCGGWWRNGYGSMGPSPRT